MFFGTHIGLGKARRLDGHTLAFGQGSRGVRISKPAAVMARSADQLVSAAGARHVAIEVSDLNGVARRLDGASVPYVEALAGDFDVPAIYTVDPAMNVVAFCQKSQDAVPGDDIQPWETAWGWGVHHVNLPAGDVREAVAFYVEIGGMTEGQWKAPAAMGKFSIDPRELAVLPLGEFNRGLHIIHPDPGFAFRNGFAHNPSIGGHPALFVPDVKAVKARLEASGTLVSDAGVYAMVGMHQLYMLDPSANMIEINQFI